MMKEKVKTNIGEVQQKLLDYLLYLDEQPAGMIFVGKKDEKAPAQTASITCEKQDKLKQLFSCFANCTTCPLATQGRKQVIFGHGNAQAQLMFIGEGPGRDEDEQGLPFVGRAGKLLTSFIESIGLKREQVYISNVVKCRPPANRTPLPIERNICKQEMLLKEIAIIAPKVICTLGATATQALLGDDISISKTRGMFFELNNIPVMPTYHPAYVLRNPAANQTVLDDMQKILGKLNV